MFNYTDLPKNIVIEGIELKYLPINQYQPQKRLTVVNSDRVYNIANLSFRAFAQRTNDVFLTFTHEFIEKYEGNSMVFYQGKAYKTKKGYMIKNNLFTYTPLRTVRLSEIPTKGVGVYSDQSGYKIEYDSDKNFYEYDDIGCGIIKRNPLIVTDELLKMKFAKDDKWFK